MKETKKSIEKSQGLIAQETLWADMVKRSPAYGMGSLKPQCPWLGQEDDRQNGKGPSYTGEAPARSDWAEATVVFIQLTAFIFPK